MLDKTPMDRSRRFPLRWALLLVFLLAISIRLSFFQAVRGGSISMPDTAGYLALAESIRRDGAYSTETPSGAPGGFPTDLQRPPGYPLFLCFLNAGSRTDLVRAALLQSLLGGIFAVVLVALIARAINQRVGILAGIFYATDWITILHTPIIMAEWLLSVTLALATIAYAFYLLRQRAGYAWLAGLALGLAALIKPAAQVHLLSFAIAWLLQSKRLPIGLVFLMSYAICVTPWMARNWHQHGLFTLSAVPTVTQYFFTAQGAKGNLTGLALDAKVSELDGEWNAKTPTPAERARMMRSESWQLIRHHWPTVIKQAAIGFLRTCFGTGRETLIRAISMKGERLSPFWHTSLPLMQMLVLYGFAAIGFRRGFGPSSRALLGLMASVILLSLVPSASPVGYSRFRVHAVPIICMLAAMGASGVFTSRENA